jgi:hypothetical protein
VGNGNTYQASASPVSQNVDPVDTCHEFFVIFTSVYFQARALPHYEFVRSDVGQFGIHDDGMVMLDML